MFKTKFEVKDFLKSAARAWAGAAVDIQKFAECYTSAAYLFGCEAKEAFKAAYPMFGKREWRKLQLIGDGRLLPQFMFKSDSFVGKLLRLKDSMKWQQALVSASKDGFIRVDRGSGPEEVRLSDLTRRENKILAMLLSEADEALEPEELGEKFRTMMRKINRTRKRRARTARAMLDDLCEAIRELESLRDEEWEFAGRHGIDGALWDDDAREAHDEILDAIQRARDKVTALVREATGNNKICV